MVASRAVQLNFPIKQSLGALYLAGLAFPHQRQWIGDAKGSISLTLPENKNFGLALGQSGYQELLALNPKESKEILSLDFSSSSFTDKTTQAIPALSSALSQLAELRLDFLKLGLRQISSLCQFSELKTLWLNETDVRDDIAEPLTTLVNLKHLVLKKTLITDNALLTLRRLGALQTLIVPSQITDQGLDYVSQMGSLKRLDLSYTKISDNGLECLIGHQSLSELYLNDTKLSDLACSHLSQMQTLKAIFLSGTKITDGGVMSLEKLHNLEHLELRDTDVTQMGIARLRNRLPSCDIFGP